MSRSIEVTIQVNDPDAHKSGSLTTNVELRSNTLFGAAVVPYAGTNNTWISEIGRHEGDLGDLRILRSYDGGRPSEWATKSTVAGSRSPAIPGYDRHASWHSMKPAMDTNIESWLYQYLDSIPVTGQPRWLTLWHEPEAKVKAGKFTWEEWALQQERALDTIRDVQHPDVKFGPCFMAQWSLGDKPYHLPALVAQGLHTWMSHADFIGWDVYHEDSRSHRYDKAFTPAYYLDPVVNYTANILSDKPIAIGETGMVPSAAGQNVRGQWLKEYADYAEANKFQAVCYFDAHLEGEPDWRLRVDAQGVRDLASIAAWSEVYSR